MKLRIKRPILPYSIVIILTLVLGPLSRTSIIEFPKFISAYTGDTMWALFVFAGLCIIFRNLQTWKITSIALIFSFLIELSQFYHAPWIDSIRQTKIGGLIFGFGFGFMFSDLICYIIGITVGALFDQYIIRDLNNET